MSVVHHILKPFDMFLKHLFLGGAFLFLFYKNNALSVICLASDVSVSFSG